MQDLARTPKQLGSLIKRARLEQGLTQAELAEKVGLRQESISKVESGAESPKISTILDILMALELEIVVRDRSKGSPQSIEDLF